MVVVYNVQSIDGDSDGSYKAMDFNGEYNIVGIHSGQLSYEPRAIYTNMINIMEAFNVTPIAGE